MKRSYPYFTFLLSFLILFSCSTDEKEYHPNHSMTALSAQEKLEKMAPPLVLFQYSYVDLNTGIETGWIIDKVGSMKTYEYHHSSESRLSSGNQNWNELMLANLYALSTNEVGTIDFNELQNRLHQGYSLSRKFLTHTEEDHNADYQVGFYAFSPSEESGVVQKTFDGCDYGSPNYNPVTGTHSGASIKRQIVQLSGYYTRHETSTYATDLYQWLNNKNEEL